MKENYKSIRQNILMSMILVPVIPFIICLGIGYHHFTRSLETSTIATMKRIVEDHRQMIESFLTERTNDLEFILHAYSFEDLSRPETLQTVFDNLQSRSEAFVDLGIFDHDGRHVSYQGPFTALRQKVYREEVWFREVMQKGYYISDIFLGYRQVPHFVIALARNGESGKWIIRATIDTQTFNNLVEKVHIGKTGEAYILNTQGILQTRQRIGKGLMEKADEQIRFPEAGENIRTFISDGNNGAEYLYATTWLKDKKWLLVVRQEENDAFAALHSAIFGIVLMSILGLIIIAGVAFYVTDRIIEKMKQQDSEKEQLGQHLIRAQRLAELGEMSTGFAHEINNPLQIIKSEQSLIDMNLNDLREKGELRPSPLLAEVEDSMKQISLQITRCAGITQSILKFGRQSDPKFQDVDLREFIPQITGMVSKRASVNGVALTQDISDTISPVYGDPGQLQQVMLNLFNNAMDAITERHGASGGQLSISARPKDSRTVSVSVRDNGCGISSENVKKVFSPFFTTKPVGKGTGLGLSVCYGIVDSMGGTMEIRSQKGQGTTFTVNLPVSNGHRKQ